MPIPVNCPECGATRSVADDLEGKVIKCKFCNGRIPVRRSSATKVGKKSKKTKRRKQSSNIGLIIGGGVGTLVVLIGLIVFFLTRPGDDAEQQVANQDAPAEASAPAENPAGSEPNTPAENGQMAGAPAEGFKATPATTSPSEPVSAQPAAGGGGSGFQKSPAKVEDTLTFSLAAEWTVKPDPPQGDLEYEAGKPIRTKLAKDNLRGNGLVFPVSPSSFVAVNTGNDDLYEVRNVVTGRTVGSVSLSGFIASTAVAGDGSYFAGAGADEIEVFDIQAKKSLGKLSTVTSGKFNVSHLAIWKNRLVAMSFVHKGIKVWELPSGKLLHDIKSDDKFNPDYGYAFSPGGRYLAVDAQFLEKRIDFYDLESGLVVGSITPAGKIRVNELEAMGFSRDGTQFAAIYGVDLYGTPSRKYSRMMVWDVSSGEVFADFEIEPKLKDQLEPVYKSHELESFPGGTRWLAHSLGIIDVAEQKVIYGFPKQEGVDLVPSRKVMAANWVLAATTDKGDPRLEAITVTQEDLLAGAKSAAAGGIASDANLPPLTAIDISTAVDALPSTQWTAQPDPLQASPVKDSIRVETTGTVREVVLSRGATPVVAVRAGINENLNDRESSAYTRLVNVLESKGVDLNRVDLVNKQQPVAKETELLAYDANGSQIAKLRFPFSARLHGISPEGKLAIFEEHRTQGRLDVFEVADNGQHVAGWRPFRDESDKFNREIRKAEFIDETHVATLSKNYTFAVWKLPDVEAVWKLKEVYDFEISPGGKLVAAVRGNILGSRGLDFFQSQTGEGLGSIELEEKLSALAFSPDGLHLALSLDSNANRTVSIVDMGSGFTLEEIPVPQNATSIAWTGSDNLLLNGENLLNRPLQSLVWSYDAENVLLPRYQVTDQFTFLHLTGKRSTIRTVTVPSEKVAARFDAAKLANLAILKPGDSVQLTVQVANDALLQALNSSATESLSKQLQAADSKLDKNAPTTLAASISIKSEGNVELTKLGDRSSSETVTRKVISIDLLYTQQGKEIWKSTRRVGNLDRHLVRLKQGQPAQEAIDEQMLESVGKVLDGLKLPKYIFGANASKGLGTSSFFE